MRTELLDQCYSPTGEQGKGITKDNIGAVSSGMHYSRGSRETERERERERERQRELVDVLSLSLIHI